MGLYRSFREASIGIAEEAPLNLHILFSGRLKFFDSDTLYIRESVSQTESRGGVRRLLLFETLRANGLRLPVLRQAQ